MLEQRRRSTMFGCLGCCCTAATTTADQETKGSADAEAAQPSRVVWNSTHHSSAIYTKILERTEKQANSDMHKATTVNHWVQEQDYIPD